VFFFASVFALAHPLRIASDTPIITGGIIAILDHEITLKGFATSEGLGIAVMSFEIAYWHWVVFGMLLIIAELFVPSFTIIWFGLGALITGVVLWSSPALSTTGQLMVWVVASIAFTLFWFKFFKPRMVNRTMAGIAREAIIGESGQVIKAPMGDVRGTVRFTTPVLGADEWSFICSSDVIEGDRVYVTEISGNTLIVEKR
jgi:membrane protein implicated in regulation of membrane protease activity